MKSRSVGAGAGALAVVSLLAALPAAHAAPASFVALLPDAQGTRGLFAENWRPGWTHFTSFTIDGKTYFLSYRGADTGEVDPAQDIQAMIPPEKFRSLRQRGLI